MIVTYSISEDVIVNKCLMYEIWKNGFAHPSVINIMKNLQLHNIYKIIHLMTMSAKQHDEPFSEICS